MKAQNKPRRSGIFDYETLTVKFGGEMSNPANIFTAIAIRVPPYKITVRERESLGGGWYGEMETNTYDIKDTFLIIKDGICIGAMISPYHQKIKSDIYVDFPEKHKSAIEKHIEKLKLKFEPIRNYAKLNRP